MDKRGGRIVDPVNAAIGARVRERRLQLGQSRTPLAEALGVSQVQLLKYETGQVRIAALALWTISLQQQMEVSWYFATASDASADASLPGAGG